MNRRLVVQFVLFLLLALFASHRLGLLQGLLSDDRHRLALKEMRKQFAEFESMQETEEALYSRLNDAHTTLTGVSTAYLPDPTDPYAWATRQVTYLGKQSGVRIEFMEAGPGPRIRTQRGRDNRQFAIYRCTAELSGTLDQILALARIAEERNPHLVVSEVTVGPERPPEFLRRGQVVLDWPAWRTTGLRDELLAEIDTAVE